MKGSGCRRDVRQAVQSLPPRRPQPLDHAIRRGRRQRHHEDQTYRPHHQVRPHENFRRRVADACPPIETEEEEKVQSGVEECIKPQHSAKLAEPAITGDPAQGSDGQRQHEEKERQHPSRADGEVDWIGTQLAAPGVPAEKGDRHDAVQQDDRLGEPIDLHVHASRTAV